MMQALQYIASAIVHGIAIMLWQKGMAVSAAALFAAGVVFLFTA